MQHNLGQEPFDGRLVSVCLVRDVPPIALSCRTTLECELWDLKLLAPNHTTYGQTIPCPIQCIETTKSVTAR
jgi:hypothetical protein